MTTETSAARPARAGTDGRFPSWARRTFAANLVAQVLIVVTGAIVRLTGSGLGCPTWPECTSGSLVPTVDQHEQFHKFIEFGNRLLTFVLGALAIAAAYAAYDHVRRTRASGATRRPVVALALVPLLGTCAQAVLGGLTVLTGLSPLLVAAHLLLSMVIIAGCVTLVVRAGEPGDLPRVPVVRVELVWVTRLAVALSAAVVILGTLVTGAGPHSGDAGTPRLDLDARTLSWLHADVVMLYLGVLAALLLGARLTSAAPPFGRAVLLALGVSLLQGAIGYTQYFTGLPWVVVMFHLLGACLVWSTTVYAVLCTRTRGVRTG